MERLDLSQKPDHALEEATIHCARYANILHLVKDKIVLDIACGEGYGAALLKKAGAKRVVAIDISKDSIERAKHLFSEFDVEYLAGDANTVAEICGKEVFDIVISIETIEHIDTPDIFLTSIKSSAKKDAIFYISCPNDHWYYPSSDNSNPYHVRKYNFEEFKDLTTHCLGNNVQWGLGGAVFGFGTIPLEPKNFSKLGKSWMETDTADCSINILNTANEQLTKENCSYFVGLWNAPDTNFSNSVFGVSMDAYSRMVEEFESNVIDVLRKNQKENNSALELLRSDKDILSHELKKAQLLFLAVQAENHALRQSLARSQTTKSLISVSSYRYTRLAKIMPQPLKKLIKKAYQILKG
ncbi:class I SAM-dependent methyltransferase [Kluyvera cryocrescens]|uniref:class I SAM-dependent methyltransferase n=1 Tax=Kluyvera cryocrescens TaxID=580 RepID=UPI002DB7CFB9|nr:class I SAM-dependent methyltransferase [Kluyvera cryocrescens]MEB7558527.1 class I SAM-dependent methyltransferase [Kluyvera cryocrescens]